MSRAGKIKRILEIGVMAGVIISLLYLNDSCEREKRERKRLEELVTKTAMSEVYRELGIKYDSNNSKPLTIEEMKKYLDMHNVKYTNL